MTKGLILSAPASGAGKTTLTLGLLRALRERGVQVAGAKSGPDYIDPRFHEAASGQTCPNLDAYAMSPPRLQSLVPESSYCLIEGAMGLFDGSGGGRGSTAELARALSLPVVLMLDCARTGQSIAALVRGFLSHDQEVRIAGLILNNVGSARHSQLLQDALAPLDLPILGAVPRAPAITRPSRHLGLVQAGEMPDLESFLKAASAHIAAHIDLDHLLRLSEPLQRTGQPPRLTPPGQTIAVAQDAAFSFTYPHLLTDWRSAGAEISFFSPLEDEGPAPADFIYLPGGYPELHAARLSNNKVFHAGMQAAHDAGSLIYGECGGYMTLGQRLEDSEGVSHEMLGFLPLETSFARRKLHLGYRDLTAGQGPFQGQWAAHEFHYATTIRAEGPALFTGTDGWGAEIAPMGLVKGRVFGSFAHLIDRAP